MAKPPRRSDDHFITPWILFRWMVRRTLCCAAFVLCHAELCHALHHALDHVPLDGALRHAVLCHDLMCRAALPCVIDCEVLHCWAPCRAWAGVASAASRASAAALADPP
jgi:hypothetical protein